MSFWQQAGERLRQGKEQLNDFQKRNLNPILANKNTGKLGKGLWRLPAQTHH